MSRIIRSVEEVIDFEVNRIAQFNAAKQRADKRYKRERNYFRMDILIEIDCQLHKLGPDSSNRFFVVDKY